MIKKILYIIYFLLVVLLITNLISFFLPQARNIETRNIYKVERVIDAVTLKLTNGEEVKLIGIKAFEDEKMGQEATEFVKGLMKGKEIRIEFDVQQRDKYGRLLAYVYWRDDISVKEYNVPHISNVWYEVYENDKKYADWFLNMYLAYLSYATPVTVPPNIKYADQFQSYEGLSSPINAILD